MPTGLLGTFTTVSESRYVMTVDTYGLRFDLDRLRRERHELIGELVVYCDLPGAQTVDGMLSAADLNLSSQQARKIRAAFLEERAKTGKEVDFIRLVEEFCWRVVKFDRQGTGIRLLHDTPLPGPEQELRFGDFPVLTTQPNLIFGDGAAGKSYFALWLAGQVAQTGRSILYADWEFDAGSHRIRYHRLFGEAKLPIYYVRCVRPIHIEADRLSRVVREHGIAFVVYDSVVAASAQPGVGPETSEATSTYFAAVGQIGPGSLHLAHISKQGQREEEKGGDGNQTPFGSVFWRNFVRRSWYLRSVLLEDQHLGLSLTDTKVNTGPKESAKGFQIHFSEDRRGPVEIHPVDVASIAELASRLPVAVRMRQALRTGAKTMAALKEELGVPLNTVVQTAKRHPQQFGRVVGSDGIQKLGLVVRG